MIPWLTKKCDSYKFEVDGYCRRFPPAPSSKIFPRDSHNYYPIVRMGRFEVKEGNTEIVFHYIIACAEWTEKT